MTTWSNFQPTVQHFEVGQRVVCVDDSGHTSLVKGQEYVVDTPGEGYTVHVEGVVSWQSSSRFASFTPAQEG